MTTQPNAELPTIDQVRTMRTLADAGFSCGLGTPEPGKMCVEAAVCFALGLPHNDDPPCVGMQDRAFKITLNDCSRWSSNAARGKGMRDVMIAQLGSRGWDRAPEWRALLQKKTIQQIVPIALRASAKINPKHSEALEAAAVRCKKEGTTQAAQEARAYAAAAAAAAYAAAAAAAAYAAAANAAANAAADKILSLCASLAVEAYRELNAPGIALLDAILAEEAAR